MRPFVTKKPCLKCHAFQGYKEGDIRGGIGVTVPMQPYLSIKRKAINIMILTHSFIWLLGLVCIGFVSFRSSKKRLERKMMVESLKKHQDELEINVKERTFKLTVANEQLNQEIEKRKKITRTLQESEKRFLLAANAAQVGIWDWNLKTNDIYLDPKLKSMLGYENQEISNNIYDWNRFIYVDDRERVTSELNSYLEEKSPKFESEHRMVHKNGSIRWFLARGTVMKDSEGKPYRMVGTDTDITNRKRLEESLSTAHKLESIGILAGGIAHDFNNLLTGIMGNISLAKMYLKPEDKLNTILTNAEKASIEASHLTRQLITFARGGEPIMEKTHIGKLIKDSAIFALSGSKIKCEISIPDDPSTGSGQALWPVEVDTGHIRQVIHNIVVNAKESMPDGGTVNINAENLTIEGEGARIKGQEIIKEGRYVRISIKDSGIGIPEENLSKVFDPYFTTKEKGAEKGMGLGLSISHSIIDKHNGYLMVESTVGVGTIFHIYLPASTEKSIAKEDNILKSEIRNIQSKRGLW